MRGIKGLLALGMTTFGMTASTSAFACNLDEVSVGMDWVFQNNGDAAARIVRGVNLYASEHSAINDIIGGYKDGQSHNSSASAAIDGCGGIPLFELASSIASRYPVPEEGGGILGGLFDFVIDIF